MRTAFAELERTAQSQLEPPDSASCVIQAFDELVESSWRLQASALHALDNILCGRPVASSNPNAPISEIQARLEEARSSAPREFASLLGVEALAARPSGLTDQEFGGFEEAAMRLLAGMAGVDAGYCLGIVVETLKVRPPTWMTGGQVPYATELLARMLFGAAGAEVREIASDGRRIVVAPLRAEAQFDPLRLLTAIASLAPTLRGTERFSVYDTAGDLLIEASAAALRAAQEGPETTSDLALVACFYDALVARGEARDAAVSKLAATQLIVTVLPAIASIDDLGWTSHDYLRLATRLGYVNEFVNRHRLPTKTLRRLGERLSRAVASATVASQGDRTASARLRHQLPGLRDWAANNSDWPPF